jgi:Gpi18-like mannosyltransferase
VGLISVYFLLKERPLPALISFGISLSFKAQAVFLVPFLFLLTLKKRIPWTCYTVVPLVYILMMAPAVLVGRPWEDMLTIYSEQANTYNQLSMKAPNLYLLVPAELYTQGLLFGFGFAFLFILSLTLFYTRKIKRETPANFLVFAAVSALLMPFFLPKMHERYFYLADVLLFITAFYIPKLWIAAVASQIVSSTTYAVYLFLGTRTFPIYATPMLIFAMLLNTALVTFLLLEQYFITSEQNNRPFQTASQI